MMTEPERSIEDLRKELCLLKFNQYWLSILGKDLFVTDRPTDTDLLPLITDISQPVQILVGLALVHLEENDNPNKDLILSSCWNMVRKDIPWGTKQIIARQIVDYVRGV